MADARDGVPCEHAQVRLEFAEGHLDRMKIGRVLRQIAKRCAGSLDRLRDAGNLVGARLSTTTISFGLSHSPGVRFGHC
jgi:hypothetical protein